MNTVRLIRGHKINLKHKVYFCSSALILTIYSSTSRLVNKLIFVTKCKAVNSFSQNVSINLCQLAFLFFLML